MSLQTGKRIHRHGWTTLPIIKEVINRVDNIGKKQNQPLVRGNFNYSWSCSENDQNTNVPVEVEEEEASVHTTNTGHDNIVDNEENIGKLLEDLPEW